MPLEFSCTCGKKLRAKEEHAGKKVKCPACDEINIVPAPAKVEAVSVKPPPLPESDPSEPEDDVRPKKKKKSKDEGLTKDEISQMYFADAEKELKKRSPRRKNVRFGPDGDGGFLMFGVYFTPGAWGGLTGLIFGIIGACCYPLYSHTRGHMRILAFSIASALISAAILFRAVVMNEED